MEYSKLSLSLPRSSTQYSTMESLVRCTKGQNIFHEQLKFNMKTNIKTKSERLKKLFIDLWSKFNNQINLTMKKFLVFKIDYLEHFWFRNDFISGNFSDFFGFNTRIFTSHFGKLYTNFPL